MAADNRELERFCPGEEHIKISEAICLGRRRANFQKCPGCQFNDDERDNPPFVAQVVRPRTASSVALQLDEDDMIEKVFKAYDVRATVPDMLNDDIAWRIGNATAQFLRTMLSGYDRSDAGMNTLIVGRDMRKSSPGLSRAFVEGANAIGTAVVDIGMVDTPQVTFATNHMPCCGGAQTTASHNPENYNGFKICGPKGKPVGQDSGLQEIQRIAAALSRHRSAEAAKVRDVDLSDPYRKFLLKHLREIRQPLKVVVDASNGMAGRWFPIIFKDVPNLEIIKLNFEHDGTFVHQPNPLNPANLEQLREAVRREQADFGACFDGDADRCIFVDENAEIIPCDLLTALLAIEYVKQSPGAAVVYDLRSSRVVAEAVEKAGGVPKRQRVGHVFMKRSLAESNGVFGGELSGHFYFRDFFNADNGFLAFIAVCNVLTRTGQPFGGLIKPLNKYAASGERNFVNNDADGTFKKLADTYSDGRIDYLDGITVQYPEWWFNARPSNTEPLLRLNLEANDAKLMEAKLAELAPVLGTPAKEH